MKYTAERIADRHAEVLAHMVDTSKRSPTCSARTATGSPTGSPAWRAAPTPPGAVAADTAGRPGGRSLRGRQPAGLPRGARRRPEPTNTMDALCDLFATAIPAIRTDPVIIRLREWIAQLRASESNPYRAMTARRYTCPSPRYRRRQRPHPAQPGPNRHHDAPEIPARLTGDTVMSPAILYRAVQMYAGDGRTVYGRVMPYGVTATVPTAWRRIASDSSSALSPDPSPNAAKKSDCSPATKRTGCRLGGPPSSAKPHDGLHASFLVAKTRDGDDALALVERRNRRRFQHRLQADSGLQRSRRHCPHRGRIARSELGWSRSVRIGAGRRYPLGAAAGPAPSPEPSPRRDFDSRPEKGSHHDYRCHRTIDRPPQ